MSGFCRVTRISPPSDTHTDKPAHTGLKQLPRRNQIKMRLDLVSVFLCHFFLCTWPIFLSCCCCCCRRDGEGGEGGGGGGRSKGGITSVLHRDRKTGRKKDADRQVKEEVAVKMTASASKQLCVLHYVEETHTLVWAPHVHSSLMCMSVHECACVCMSVREGAWGCMSVCTCPNLPDMRW